MTKKTSTSTFPDDPAAPVASVSLQEVDPAALGVDDQVRADATPDDDLVASVARFGVLQPPTVYWDADRAQHVIVMGHRRVGAAIAAKLPSIMVLVRDAEAARGARRLEQQLVENERREQLTPADVARGYKDMELFGLTPEDIAAAVSDRPERVTAALRAHKSAKATEAMVRGIDFEQAAVIAELDGHPDLQKDLTDVALTAPANFAVKADSARAAAAAAERVAELTTQLDGEGCPLIATTRWHDVWWSGGVAGIPYGDGRSLDRLEISPADHKGCPGRGAIIHNSADAEHAEIIYVCTDWKQYHDPAEQTYELTPEEIAQRQERERELEAARQREQEYRANTVARREWLRGFIRGRLNQTAGIFDLIADATIGAAQLEQVEAVEPATYRTAVFILTGEDHSYQYTDAPLQAMLASGQVTALRALVAIALATCEEYAETPWRAQRQAPRLVAAYFTHLQAWGYPFSDIDTETQRVAAERVAFFDHDDTDDEPDDDELGED